jgi:hypothetical protein
VLSREERGESDQRCESEGEAAHPSVHASDAQRRNEGVGDVQRREAVVRRIGLVQETEAPEHPAFPGSRFVDAWRDRRVEVKADVRGNPDAQIGVHRSPNQPLLPDHQDRQKNQEQIERPIDEHPSRLQRNPVIEVERRYSRQALLRHLRNEEVKRHQEQQDDHRNRHSVRPLQRCGHEAPAERNRFGSSGNAVSHGGEMVRPIAGAPLEARRASAERLRHGEAATGRSPAAVSS